MLTFTPTSSASPTRAHARHCRVDLAEHVLGERADETALLGHWDERVGRDDAPHRMTPAHERFDCRDRAGAGVGLRLVPHLELAARDRGAKLGEQLKALASVAVALGRVGLDLPRPLRDVHGDVGALEQPGRVLSVVGAHRDANRSGRVDLHVADSEAAPQHVIEHSSLGNRVVGVAARREQHRELVAAEACDGGAVDRRAGEALADFHE